MVTKQRENSVGKAITPGRLCATGRFVYTSEESFSLTQFRKGVRLSGIDRFGPYQ